MNKVNGRFGSSGVAVFGLTRDLLLLNLFLCTALHSCLYIPILFYSHNSHEWETSNWMFGWAHDKKHIQPTLPSTLSPRPPLQVTTTTTTRTTETTISAGSVISSSPLPPTTNIPSSVSLTITRPTKSTPFTNISKDNTTSVVTKDIPRSSTSARPSTHLSIPYTISPDVSTSSTFKNRFPADVHTTTHLQTSHDHTDTPTTPTYTSDTPPTYTIDLQTSDMPPMIPVCDPPNHHHHPHEAPICNKTTATYYHHNNICFDHDDHYLDKCPNFVVTKSDPVVSKLRNCPLFARDMMH